MNNMAITSDVNLNTPQQQQQHTNTPNLESYWKGRKNKQ